MRAVIRIALLDDHPAVLAGLQRLVEAPPGLSLLAAVETEEALWRQLDRTGPTWSSPTTTSHAVTASLCASG